MENGPKAPPRPATDAAMTSTARRGRVRGAAPAGHRRRYDQHGQEKPERAGEQMPLATVDPLTRAETPRAQGDGDAHLHRLQDHDPPRTARRHSLHRGADGANAVRGLRADAKRAAECRTGTAAPPRPLRSETACMTRDLVAAVSRPHRRRRRGMRRCSPPRAWPSPRRTRPVPAGPLR
ncbi:hypothetical protein SGPA1_22081 [Streptomyces misionensis JCM 4497]